MESNAIMLTQHKSSSCYYNRSASSLSSALVLNSQLSRQSKQVNILYRFFYFLPPLQKQMQFCNWNLTLYLKVMCYFLQMISVIQHGCSQMKSKTWRHQHQCLQLLNSQNVLGNRLLVHRLSGKQGLVIKLQSTGFCIRQVNYMLVGSIIETCTTSYRARNTQVLIWSVWLHSLYFI